MFDFGQSKSLNDTSYRKGLVLGFTLAEVMLLIVFCLLLISGAVLKRIENDAQQRNEPDPTLLYLKIPRDKTVFQANAPQPDNTGTIVSLWPVLSDTAKSELIVRLEKDGQLNDANETEQKLALLQNLSPDQIRSILADASKSEVAKQNIPADLIAKLEEMKVTSGGWERVKEVLNTAALTGHRWPPIIALEEAKGYAFQSGHSNITEEFGEKLTNEAVPKILKVLNDYDADIVEIIGHTDNVPIHQNAASNLDDELGPLIKGLASSDDVTVSDNAGLGLARAAAVAQLLLSDPRLSKAHIIALSAGQLLKPNGDLDFETSKVGDEKRRRLEVRIRCSTDPCSRAP